MSIAQLKDISNICMSTGLILLVAAAVMYVKMDIDKAWHFLMGRKIEGTGIKGNKSQRRSRKREDKTLALTDALPGEKRAYEECTEKLQPDWQKTVLLQPEKEEFKIVYEITYIHTDLV